MRKLVYILFLSLGFSSCEDFLNVEPDLQVSTEEQLSTRDGVVEIISGIYRDVEAYQSSDLFLYADLMGGNITFAPQISNKEINIPVNVENVYGFNETPTESDYDDRYDDFYETINQTNIVLENLNEMEFLSNDEKDQLRAEMLVIRALSHYHAYLLYAQNYNFTDDASHLGIVYNRRTLIVGEDFPARETAAQTYLFIRQDIDEALSLFNSSSFLQIGPALSYFNALTTTALYARIALQMNDWERARDFSEEMIATSGLILTSTSDYVMQWSESAQISETIMVLTAPFDTEDDGEIVTSSSVSQYFSYTNANNYDRFIASRDLVDLFDSEDIRRNLYQPQTLSTSINGITMLDDYYFTNKYQEDSGITFIRLSEMYLISAEAQERISPGSSLALDRLNEIRIRAGLSALNTSTNLLAEIFLERRKELAFESHLMYDLKRFNMPVVRIQGCIANLCNLSYPSPFFILPIPQQSISINENMQQNEGY